jgi:hypothetical protein
MGRLFLFSLGSAIVSTLAVAACVGDSPGLATPTPVEGELDSPCFANGTCNEGLSCSLVKGTAKCVPAGSTPPVDASTLVDGAVPDAPGSVPTVCKFQTTSFPCGDQMPPTACYGATQSCTLTGCNVGDLAWQCFSPRQCSTPCCLSAANATLNAGASCAEGTLQMSGASVAGAACSPTAACPAGDTRLCQANSDCPAGQKCSPVKIGGAGAAINGTIVAACVP